MRVLLGADHGGFELKEAIKAHLGGEGFDVVDVGTYTDDPTDYPDIALKVARGIAHGEAERGILVCGTGIGMAMVANKVPGVRAANITDPELTRLAREHNDANVLTLAGRFTPTPVAKQIADEFLSVEFSPEDRHHRRVGRVKQIDAER